MSLSYYDWMHDEVSVAKCMILKTPSIGNKINTSVCGLEAGCLFIYLFIFYAAFWYSCTYNDIRLSI